MTEPMVDDALVDVTQADRDAAADYFVITRSLMPGDYRAEQYRAGKRDLSRSVQLLARHRLAGVAAGREEAAAYLDYRADQYRKSVVGATIGRAMAAEQFAAALSDEATAIRHRGE